MREIKSIEESDKPPSGFTNPRWQAQHSSFDRAQPAPTRNGTAVPPAETLPKTPARSLPTLPGGQRGLETTILAEDGLSPEERRTRTHEELLVRVGKYLPCHYFDYIGGTSTGGYVS